MTPLTHTAADPTNNADRDEPAGSPRRLLELRDLRTQFAANGQVVKAVDGVSFDVDQGRCLCLVGESGSGKSITARSILGLVDPPGKVVGGEIWWSGSDGRVDLAKLGNRGERMRAIRGREIAMVFQEPMASLSPMYTIGQQLVEAIRTHRELSRKDATDLGVQLLDRVGIKDPQARMSTYPFQLSGGMCQRAMIAIALCAEPKLLIADEPTTALDVTTQSRIIRLLRSLQREHDLGVLFITHDLGVVAEMADDVAVMRRGVIVEAGSVDDVFHRAQHPYTHRLLAARPTKNPRPASESVEKKNAAEVLVGVDAVSKSYPIRGQGVFARVRGFNQVLSDVSFDIRRGEVLGLVGESGSGKTTLGRCIVGAHQPDKGKITYAGDDGHVDVATLDRQRLRDYQLRTRMIFQDPFGSLNPRKTVLDIVADPLRVHRLARGSELEDRVAQMLTKVGLPRRYLRRYPHAFSGGERQRIGIARALIVDPVCVVADEAVSALDMSVRSQVLGLLADLKEELQLTYLFISHDLTVVESICDRVAVMHRGRIVELGGAQQIFADPQDDYTRSLLAAAPPADPRQRSHD